MAGRNLLREPLQSFKPYVVGKPIETVRREFGLEGRIAKLASNENPLGTSPLALAAMHRAVEEVSLYPDDNAYYFRTEVARKHGVDFDQVFAASGSVEAIELCGVAFLNPGDVVVSSEKSFAIYSLTAAKAGAVMRLAPMIDGGFRYDLRAMVRLIDPATKIVFLANPTNPTGTWFTGEEFDAFMDRVPEDVLVVYDAAYDEYITETGLPDPMAYFRRGRRILLLRTLSKAYGLAGIRIGYAVGPTDIIHGLMTCRFPFNANLVAQAAGLAALDDVEFVRRTREHNLGELEFLRRGLEGLPVEVPPSQTNFLYIQMTRGSAEVFQELQKIGVIVRPVGPQAIRVSTGLREDNERFLEHFRRLLLA
jgi:histidinol-phosphate aminotransferase